MSVYAIIPARFASTRFPAKPLVEIRGKSMLQRVYEQCQKAASLDGVGVATDDERIFRHVEAFGGRVWMTSEIHRSGTDRIAEVAARLEEADYIINVQGDEPFIEPAQINLLVQSLQKSEAKIATLICPFTDSDDLHDPNRVKVVCNQRGEALYFSRLPIPYFRDIPKEEWLERHTYYQHIGLYGYERETLLSLTQLPPHSLELAESLEQLRWLGNGWTIQTAVGAQAGMAIDSPGDLVRLEAWLDQQGS